MDLIFLVDYSSGMTQLECNDYLKEFLNLSQVSKETGSPRLAYIPFGDGTVVSDYNVLNQIYPYN